jgi:PTS system fructose-specific IIC component
MQVSTTQLVELDLDGSATTKDAAVDRLVAVASAAGRASDPAQLRSDVAAREELLPTGIEGGIGIPHARSTGIDEPTVVFGRSTNGIDWGAADGPAHLVFLIAVPEGAGDEHLQILASLSRALMKPEFRDTLLKAGDPQVVVDTINAAAAPAAVAAPAAAAAAPVAAATPAPAPTPKEKQSMKFVGVTSCPTGIAHTYMAAEALEQAAKAAGHEIVIEPQGSGGFKSLDPQVIAEADAVIFACDVEVRDRGRFFGKPTVAVGVKRAINDGPALIAEAERLALAGEISGAAQGPASAAAPRMSTKGDEGGFGAKLRGWLMTGVSYLIPFIAAGGILIALSFALGGYTIVEVTVADLVADVQVLNPEWWAGLMFVIGGNLFGFLLPVLAGFIAYAIADRPGIVVGFAGGWASSVALPTGVEGVSSSPGFLGAIVAGLIGGGIALWMQRWKVPNAVRGVMPVVVIPLVGSFINAGLMLTLIGKPLASAAAKLSGWLTDLSGGSAILLGIILGLMMAFDMGGPVNKVAYAFAITGLTAAGTTAADSDPRFAIMAAVMAAGMVPPLAMALSTVIRPRLYNEAEREQGKAAWLLGASFITEGAIPFAAADPIRVIPSLMAGSAVTGGLVMLFENSLRAPHGGVWVFGLVGNWPMYILAIAVGTVISALLVSVAKSKGGADVEIGEGEHALVHA